MQMSTTNQPLGVGMVGAGGFGRFCLRAYSGLCSVRLVAVCDSHAQRLQAVAQEFGLKAYGSYEQMLADPDVHIVAINTPPALHAGQVIAAISAGKHVFCEKPLATTVEDVERVLRVTHDAGVALGINYVMRRNPLYRLLSRLSGLQVEGGHGQGSEPVLGKLRRFSVENFAADEHLGPDHWFWDEQVSGGIFVEHGVHFFDLCDWQMGCRPVRAVALAVAGSRPDLYRGVTDTVQGIVEYEGGATGSFYHSFARAVAAEHQTITLGWDWATAVLHGWIALDLKLEALVDDAGLEALADLLAEGEGMLCLPGEPALPGAHLGWRVVERFPGGQRMRGRGQECLATARVQLEAALGGPEAKQTVYEQSVRAGMADLLAAIFGSPPGVPYADMWSSTAVAVACHQAALFGCAVSVPPAPEWLCS
jgi:predicted dehydrogenase